MSQALDALRNAGTPVDLLSDTERAVFSALSPDEVAVLTAIQGRLNDAAAAVQGQVADNNNNSVC
jgi:hypothetical protein